MTKRLYKHVFVFNTKDNSGEALCLVTDFFGQPNGTIFTSQELTLQSYCNSATFNLVGADITPENLRELANQLEAIEIEVKLKYKGAT